MLLNPLLSVVLERLKERLSLTKLEWGRAFFTPTAFFTPQRFVLLEMHRNKGTMETNALELASDSA